MDLVVQYLDEPERDLVAWIAVGGDAGPVPIDHFGELLVGLEAFPFQLRPLVLEELPCPRLAAIVLHLPERVLQQICGVEPSVGCEQPLEVLACQTLEVVGMGEQSVLLALDERALCGPSFPRETGRTHPCSARSDPPRRTRSAALPMQVADHDAIDVALADGGLVDPPLRLGTRLGGALELRSHVAHLQALDRLPIEIHLLGDVLGRPSAAAAPDLAGKALCVQRVLQQELQPLALHLATDGSRPAALPAPGRSGTARTADSELAAACGPTSLDEPCRRCRRLLYPCRTSGSPNNPCTVALGRRPRKVYASTWRRALRVLGIRPSCQISAGPPPAIDPANKGVSASSNPVFYPHGITKTPFFFPT